jgi:ABC-type lipoprotein release transport system permease subunit
MSTTEILLWIAVATIVVLIVVVAYQNTRIERLTDRIGALRKIVTDLRTEASHLRMRDAAHKMSIQAATVAIAPLLEKTDWMSGRWNGQFGALVQKENYRNNAVDRVRKALIDSPGVSDFTTEHRVDILKGVSEQIGKKALS